MGLTKYKLGELIELCETRNDNLKYGVKDVKGISIQKEFIETKANMEGVSLKPYYLVQPDDFVYVTVTSRNGEKITLAHNISDSTYIVSSSYVVFKVKRIELLLPDYLFMYFNRPEFDRFSRFNSWGSARETFNWEDMCDIDIELPNIDIQQKYVDVYNAMLENQKSYESGLKNMFTGYDLSPFLNPECDPIERYRLLAKAAEYVFVSTEELQSEGNKGVQKVSFKTYFLKTVKRMRAAFDICQPSGYLGEEESALAQCFMAIAGFVRKMSGTSEVDTDTMNRAVSKMVEEALKYNQVESVLESGEEEDIFSPEYFEKLSDVKMPATKLELLVKMLRKQIKEYRKVNRLAAKTYQEMLEKTIAEYHERRKHLSAEEAGEAQEQVSEAVYCYLVSGRR